MRKFIARASVVILLLVVSTGCTINRKVEPVAAGTAIKTIAIQRNPKVHMEGLHPELVSQLEQLGFKVETYETARPDSTPFFLLYTANWQWDMAMYLTYFQAILLEDGKKIGEVEYDARRGGGRMDKFGGTADKIRPLLIDLLNHVERAKPTPAPVPVAETAEVAASSES